MGQQILQGVLSKAGACASIEQVQTNVIGCDLQNMERQTIAFLYELWRLQGITNKKIVTVRHGNHSR